ncbi:hypothetical protein POM88_038836 [Heracleum sosnowskyi]|uniref:Transposase-associated domain-containing protein n=1 Tax=Heracleum sosnowskyi TaxID=360622 RepID=A0AAD8H9B3_9APIA|nr:hypothetical protein POM88_038836 [Heracleum sosnowskyi]
MSSNRNWISRHKQRGVNGLSQDFLNGINEFISFSERNFKEADGTIRCPFCTCCNYTLKSLDEVRFDIVSNGFLPNYTYWDSHGEGGEDLYSSKSDEDSHSSGSRDEIDDADDDLFDPYEMLRDAGGFGGDWGFTLFPLRSDSSIQFVCFFSSCLSMLGRRPVGGGRRGGSNGVGHKRDVDEGGRRYGGGGRRHVGVGDRRDGGGGGRRHVGVGGRTDGDGGSRRDGGVGGRRDGVGGGRGDGGGSGRRDVVGVGGMRDDGTDIRGDVKGRSRSLDVGSASGSRGRGGKSVNGGSGSRVEVVVLVAGDELRYMNTGSSEDSDYEDEYDDDDNEFSDDEGDTGSEDEDEVEGGNEDEGDKSRDNEGHEIEGQGVEGNDREGSEDDEEVTGEHNRRGYSLGLFRNPPPEPIRIRMVGRVIDSPVACRTLRALMRVHWPAGCVGAKDIDRRFPRWWSPIRKMFFRYYDFEPKHGTKNDAREAINRHMRRNMHNILCNEQKRIKKIISEKGGSFIDHRPPYLTEACRAWDIKDKTGKEPTLYELFIRLHTKDKDNKEFTSEAVRLIVEKFLAKCGEHNEDPFAVPIDTWVEVVGVRKNAIIGLPRTSASELIALPPTSGKRRRRRFVDDESGASTDRSVIEHIADGLVMQVVDRTVAFARAHPDQFDLAPEQVNMLAQSVAEGVSDLPPDHPLTMATMRELVQVMVSVLGDVYGDNHSTSNCNRGKSIAREDEHGSDDDEGQSPPGRSRSGDRNGIWIRGD